MAYLFNGSDTNGVAYGENPLLSNISGFSAACMITPNGTNSEQRLLTHGDTYGGDAGWNIIQTSNNLYRLEIRSLAGFPQCFSLTNRKLGIPQCIGFTFNGIQADFYIDGILESSLTLTANSLATQTYTAFGRFGSGNMFNVWFPFNGVYHWGAIWTGALSSGEMASLAKGFHPLKVSPNKLYDCDDSTISGGLLGKFTQFNRVLATKTDSYKIYR